MGYIKNECLVVSGWDGKAVSKARDKAIAVYRDHAMEDLVGDLVPHAINGGAAFLIAPDGSKEGWEHSDKANAARDEFISILKADRSYLEWCHLLIGGDDGEYRVLNSPNGAEDAVNASSTTRI
jgi:hypothetical protein